jgi:transcriptional regulator with XRE-family HTH domain
MFKNARQVEFAELVEAMKEKGVKPAGVARLLTVSKATVSKILAGKQTPEEKTLGLLRRVVAEHSKPSGPNYPTGGEDLVLRDEYAIRMQQLPDKARRSAHGVIDLLDTNSAEASAAIDAVVVALRAARQVDPKSPPSPKAGVPTSRKRKPKPGTDSHSSAPPAPPGPAPK